MAERYRRPDWVRRLNVMADAIGGDARRLVPIDGVSMLADAPPAGDFGDPDWRARFADLAAALDASPMHVVGRLMTRQELLRTLRTRIMLGRALDATPAIAAERVTAPMIVTGPARSGTTILFELLSLDATLRAPLACEALHPLPRRPAGRTWLLKTPGHPLTIESLFATYPMRGSSRRIAIRRRRSRRR
jgi:hypothetical protein